MAKGIREMRRRIHSVSNTEQITKTMKMVSAAKLRRAEAAAYQARDYTDAVMSVVNRVISQMDKSELSHPFLQENTNGKTAIIVITSDRGLCGAFNGNLIRTGFEEYQKATNLNGGCLMVLGNRGVDAYRRMKIGLEHSGRDIGDSANVLTLRQLTPKIEQLWKKEGYTNLKVVYAYHATSISYQVRVLDVLPFRAESSSVKSAQYLFEPGAEAVVSSLLPSYLEASLFKALLETKASEHGARMAAMDNATRNAADMIKRLTLHMNRLRQSAITDELLEIINGAEALKG